MRNSWYIFLLTVLVAAAAYIGWQIWQGYGDEEVQLTEEQERFSQPISDFPERLSNSKDEYIEPRGYFDGEERVLVKGELVSWNSKGIVLKGLGEVYEMDFPLRYKGYCVDEYIEGQKTSEGFIDFNQNLDDGKYIGEKDLDKMFNEGDDAVVVAEYEEEKLTALMVVGYGCEL